ncbi:hypothetical protein I5M27_02380 [Adhaeribacter sp. BT258]|uniref:Uncharacterized protein n=1 Tax=Adhaeribacter terrigena TaxID=2793070 RepID=A0ABS1BY43_9BACT|nr:hypothetical protein [Adhaeribacter terrigena]MBK0401812.1 hypothetical protein [Adhaeribacter terrigena]
MILKYSFLNPEETLVKYLKNDKYGIYDLSKSAMLIKAKFDYIGIDNNQIIGETDREFFLITLPEYNEIKLLNYEPDFFFYKFDRCPACAGGGCQGCDGIGMQKIPFITNQID